MTDPRRTLVVRWLAAGDAGDLDAFNDLFHPDAVVHAPLGLSTTAVEDEKSVWRKAIVNMPGIRHEVQEVVVEGDVEMARVVVSGTMASEFGGLPGTGRAFRIDQAVITTFATAGSPRHGRSRTSPRCKHRPPNLAGKDAAGVPAAQGCTRGGASPVVAMLDV